VTLLSPFPSTSNPHLFFFFLLSLSSYFLFLGIKVEEYKEAIEAPPNADFLETLISKNFDYVTKQQRNPAPVKRQAQTHFVRVPF